MRGVLLHLRDTTEAEVAEFLQHTYPSQPAPPWICHADGDPCLYIYFYRDRLHEFEPEDLIALDRALGREPAVSVIADVSGRHPGDDQVHSFVTKMLGQFAGVAQDDYTRHYWTAAELPSGFQVEGRRFFDYTQD